MATTDVLFRVRLHDGDPATLANFEAGTGGNLLVVTSQRGGTNPYIEDEPRGDGQSFDPVTGKATAGEYTIRVIDAPGTTALETVVWQEDFGTYADTAAVLAVWSVEDDPDNIATWTLDATHVLTSLKAFRQTIDGTSTGASNTKRSRVVSGLLPNTTYKFYASVYLTGDAVPGYTLNAWNTLAPYNVTTDGSGNATVLIGGNVTGAGYHFQDNWWDRLYLTLPGSQFGRIVTSVLGGTDGKPQVIARRATIEKSTDGGSTWPKLALGYLTGCRLADALVWELSIGQPRRYEERATIFAQRSTSFPNVTPILGGPVFEDFAGVRSEPRPLFRVTSKTASTVTLQLVYGFMPPLYAGSSYLSQARDGLEEIARRARGYFVSSTAYSGVGGYFPRLQVNLYSSSSGAFVSTKTPIAQPLGTLARIIGFLSHGRSWIARDSNITDLGGHLTLDWTTSQPNVGTLYTLDITPIDVSETNPMHIIDHPVDVRTKLWDEIGVVYDATSAATTRAALGDDLVVELRITDPPQHRSFVTGVLYGPFGFSERINAAGERELFTTRLAQTSLPSTTVDDDSLRSDASKFYALDEDSMCNVVTWDGKRFAEYEPSSTDKATFPNVPTDLVAEAGEKIRVAYDSDGDGNPDEDTIGAHEQVYHIPGSARLLGSIKQYGWLLGFVTAIADEIFERFGGSNPRYELLVADSITEVLGDLVQVEVSAIPGSDALLTPVSQRGIARIAQIIQRTETTVGPLLVCADAGLALATGLLPTFTIAASAGSPKKIATVTLTNATFLASAQALVRAQWAKSASPTGVSLLAVIDPLTTTTLDTPPADAGSVIAVRMRAEVAGTQPGAWTSWQSVDLADLVAPSGLSAVATGTSIAMSWPVGEANEPVVVVYRTLGATYWNEVATLPAGSVQYTLLLSLNATNYEVGVFHREVPPFAGVSPLTSTSTTTGGLASLNPPTNPQVFAGSIDPNTGLVVIDGTYGLTVQGTEFPSETEFEVAIETAIGSGTPGSYTLVSTLPTQANGLTIFTDQAPNDGLLRYLQARHTRVGASPSSYTTALSVDPWSATLLPQASDADVVLVNLSSAWPNARKLAVADGLKLTDGGAGGNITVGVTVGGVDSDKLDASGANVGDVLKVTTGPTADFLPDLVTLDVIFNEGGGVLTTGQKMAVRVTFAATIVGVSLLAAQTGSVVIDIWKDTHANAPPTVADTITASAKPTLSSAQKYEDTTLTGWTTSVAAGDWLVFNIDSVATITKLTLALAMKRL